jgi:hypothetical protein
MLEGMETRQVRADLRVPVSFEIGRNVFGTQGEVPAGTVLLRSEGAGFTERKLFVTALIA